MYTHAMIVICIARPAAQHSDVPFQTTSTTRLAGWRIAMHSSDSQQHAKAGSASALTFAPTVGLARGSWIPMSHGLAYQMAHLHARASQHGANEEDSITRQQRC
jgi:hypothetical protein